MNKRLMILLSGCLLVGSTAKLGAYCFYNDSDYKAIDVMVFKNVKDAAKVLEGAHWIDTAGEPIAEIATGVGEAVTEAVEDPRVKAVGVAVGAVGKLTPVLGDIAKRTTMEALKTARHTISNQKGPKEEGLLGYECRNWSDIRARHKKDNIKSMYVIIFDANGKFDDILFQGPLDIRCALIFKGKGEVVSNYPFYNGKGQKVYVPYEEGKSYYDWQYISWDDYLKKGKTTSWKNYFEKGKGKKKQDKPAQRG